METQTKKQHLAFQAKEGQGKAQGFFSFALVLAMMAILLATSVPLLESQNTFSETKTELMKAEQAQKERTLLESGADKIVSIKLAEQIEKQNFNPILIQNEINSALLNYLGGKAFATNIFFSEKKPLTLEYLNQNTSAFVLRTQGVTYAEYSYTSTPVKNTIVAAILGGKTKSYFTIPIDYTKRLTK